MRRWPSVNRSVSRLARSLAVIAVVTAVLIPAGAGSVAASERYVDIDISDQVLSQVVDGQVAYSTHISTGNGEWYWYEGEWWLAETPRGWFQIYAKDPGWQEGSLGWLYSPMYFFEGFAIHGSTSVPNYPASHGCVRVTLADADFLFDHIELGTSVFVHD